MALQNRQTQTKLLLFIYIFPETNLLCVCVCVLFLLINKNSSVLKSGKQVQTVKLRTIICIAFQETINRNSLFVPQCRLFNKLVNFFLFARSVFSYLCPRATVTVALVAEYIPTFIAIFHKYISFFRLGSNFKQRRRSLPQANK